MKCTKSRRKETTTMPKRMSKKKKKLKSKVVLADKNYLLKCSRRISNKQNKNKKKKKLKWLIRLRASKKKKLNLRSRNMRHSRNITKHAVLLKKTKMARQQHLSLHFYKVKWTGNTTKCLFLTQSSQKITSTSILVAEICGKVLLTLKIK
jgi:hypothetical protein